MFDIYEPLGSEMSIGFIFYQISIHDILQFVHVNCLEVAVHYYVKLID